ncbi:hypothetical protein MTO96_049198 [Rhipicephalus appendiculatus]
MASWLLHVASVARGATGRAPSQVFTTSQEWRKINGRDSPGEGSELKPLKAAGLNERAISDGQIALAASVIRTPLPSEYSERRSAGLNARSSSERKTANASCPDVDM